MDLIQNDGVQGAEQRGRALPGAEQSQLFRRGDKDVRRMLALALLLGLRRVARAGLDGNGQTHLFDRRDQIAMHINAQSLERRNIEGVQPAPGDTRVGKIDQAGQKPRQSLAAAGRSDQQGVVAIPGRLDHSELVPSWPPAARGEPLVKRGRQSPALPALPPLQMVCAHESH